MPTPTFRTAVEADWPAITRLLAEAGLPQEGARECLPYFLLAFEAERLVGCAALEPYGDVALLRSVAVAPGARGSGLGAELVRGVLTEKEGRRFHTIYLLTATAAGFFRRFGFVPAERSEAPVALRASPEFRGACPADAPLLWLVMEKRRESTDRVLGGILKNVLFVCVHNAGRSQMAEAFLNHIAHERGLPVRAASAGTVAGGEINPAALAVMAEIGIGMEGQYSKPLTPEIAETAERIITMGCGVDAEACPARLRPLLEDWGLDDPKGQPIEAVRAIRDQIREKVESLLAEVSAGVNGSRP